MRLGSALARLQTEEGRVRTRVLAGADFTGIRAFALDLQIVGQKLDVALLRGVFAPEDVLRKVAKPIRDGARAFKVRARRRGALLIVQLLVRFRLREQIGGEIGASRGDLKRNRDDGGQAERRRLLDALRGLRRRRLSLRSRARRASVFAFVRLASASRGIYSRRFVARRAVRARVPRRRSRSFGIVQIRYLR